LTASPSAAADGPTTASPSTESVVLQADGCATTTGAATAARAPLIDEVDSRDTATLVDWPAKDSTVGSVRLAYFTS
jgi:hypothetical protein